MLLVSSVVHNYRVHRAYEFPVKLILCVSELMLVLLDCQCFCALYRGCRLYIYQSIYIIYFMPSEVLSPTKLFSTFIHQTFFTMTVLALSRYLHGPLHYGLWVFHYLKHTPYLYQALQQPIRLKMITSHLAGKTTVGFSVLPEVCVTYLS